MNQRKRPQERLAQIASYCFGVASVLVMTACATTDERAPKEVDPQTAAVIKNSQTPYSQALAETVDRKKTGADDPERSKVFKGSGIMVKGQQPEGIAPAAGLAASRQGGNVVLNFEAADLREVIRNILGDILGEAYLIDPSVNGQVTIRTTTGLPREALYATLETLLRMNNATMVKEGGVFKILPAAAGAKGSVTPQLGGSQRPLPKGYSVQIVPLHYVSAKEMIKILEPFAKDAQAVRSDDLRNLLVLSGTELELRHLLETIDMFDIDWMAGMSVGIFTLKNTDVKSFVQDMQGALGGDNAALLNGIVKFIPIERMNALMVISPQPAYLDEVKKWIEKFDDLGAGGDGPRFYVYPLRYARADKVAPLLQQAFTGKVTTPAKPQPTLAPGVPSASIGSSPFGGSSSRGTTAQTTNSGIGSAFNRTQTMGQPSAVAGGATGMAGNAATGAGVGGNRTVRAGSAGVGTDGGMGIAREIQAVPDEDNNAILIVATPGEYALVEQALKKLDVPQRQVVMEVTMAEVRLSDKTTVGSRWWFGDNTVWGALGTVGSPLGTGSIGTPTFTPPAAAQNAFSLIIKPGSSVRAIIDANASGGDVKLVANPHISALDNQEASIDVTQQIPYQTTNYIGTTGDTTTTTYQYVEVGVRAKMKPHINEGGNVSMEAAIEFSAPDAGYVLGSNTAPPVSKRSITSQLMVPSGGTMVIGGLIQDTNSSTNAGIPYLSRIPVLGALFGSQSWDNQRTELVIFITPRVVDNDATRLQIIRDLRYRMDNLEGLLQKTKVLPRDIAQKLDVITTPEAAGKTSQGVVEKCIGQECK